MPVDVSSPIPAVLAKLGPLDADRVADLRPYPDSVPDPRSRRGRWYSLTASLLVCACATVSGARSIDELAEQGHRADAAVLAACGNRRHLLKWRHAPSRSTIGRALEHLDSDALDRAVGAYLTDRLHTQTNDTAPERPLPIIAVDGKALQGSARLDQARRHLLSTLDHAGPVTIAGAEVGSKTNETRHCKPLLSPLDLAGAVITFNALHSVQDHAKWLVKTKKAHYIAIIKANQPTAHTQLSAPWNTVPVQDSRSETGHGRRESRSIKTMAVADNLGGLTFPNAKLALRVHRRRKETGKKEAKAITTEPERALPILGINHQPNRQGT